MNKHLRKLARSVGVCSIAALAAVACGSTGASATIPGDPARKVALSEWCGAVGERMCSEMGERCVGGGMGDAFTAGCVDGFVPGCLAGRDAATATGRTGADLQACSTALTTIPCDQMLAIAGMDTCSVTISDAGGEMSTPAP